CVSCGVSRCRAGVSACGARGASRRCCCFCQAEDGIRDSSVTGVQTCALPISQTHTDTHTQTHHTHTHTECYHNEIGRASCRERSVDLGGRRIIKKKRTHCVCCVVGVIVRCITSYISLEGCGG